MIRIITIAFLSMTFSAKGQMSCNATVTPNQFFYSNSVSSGTWSTGVRQLLCGPNTVVYDSNSVIISGACFNSYLNPNCTLSVNSNCPGPQYYWLKAGSVLNLGPNASGPNTVWLEPGATFNNPFSIPTGTVSCPSVTFPNSVCTTGINTHSYQDNVFRVYPNPSSSIVNIDLADKSYNLADIIITNQIGEIVLHRYQVAVSLIEIPINSISDGLYFIQVKTKYEQQVEKLIIHH